MTERVIGRLQGLDADARHGERTTMRMAEASAHHGDHRPGRLLPGGAPLERGLRGHRDGEAFVHGELRAHRHDPGPADPCAGRPARRGVSHRDPPRAPARRGLQPRRPVVRPDFVEPAGAHGRDHCSRCDPHARRDQDRGPRDPLLPGVVFRDVREGPGGPTDREHAVLPAKPLRGGQGLRALDHRQLPRELRAPRVVGDPLQPRQPAARSRVRGAEGLPRRRTHRAAGSTTSCRWATSTPSATGDSPATT